MARLHARVPFVVSALALAAPAFGAVDPRAAEAVFRDAIAICDRDGGALWGRPLCGPILLVDPGDGAIVANQADADGVLKASGGVFTGKMPSSATVANSPITWSGTLWTEMLWPLPDDDAWRHVMVAHEMFHRIQPDLGMERGDGDNRHLDTIDGRVLLQLEWRALAKALRAPDEAARRAAVSDALLFRRERYRLFPAAAVAEGALERNEGVAEYTGVRLGLATPQARLAYALHDLAFFVSAPTFVRSFAYATGPAYGLLLDESDPDWRTKLRTSGQRLDELLATAMRLPASSFGDLKAREAAYDGPALRVAEQKRAQDKAARLAALKKKLVDGPVLTLPVLHGDYQFNPQTLQPLGDAGTVYPTLRLSADWGVLEVQHDALMDPAMKTVAVSAAGVTSTDVRSADWQLTLKPGWVVRPATRPGDWVVEPGPKP